MDARNPDAAERTLVVRRTFDAPRDLVWRAWSDPREIVKWMGPRSHPAKSFTLDARVGGEWRGCLVAADGSEELWQGGVVREIRPPERLVYTFAWEQADGSRGPETVVELTFAEKDGKTELTLRQSPFNTRENRDGHNAGWNSAFDRLDDFLAGRL